MKKYILTLSMILAASPAFSDIKNKPDAVIVHFERAIKFNGKSCERTGDKAVQLKSRKTRTLKEIVNFETVPTVNCEISYKGNEEEFNISQNEAIKMRAVYHDYEATWTSDELQVTLSCVNKDLSAFEDGENIHKINSAMAGTLRILE